MTIRDLSKVTGLSPIAISNLEAEKTRATLPNLRMLAKTLRVPISFLGCFEHLPEKTLGQRITKARLFHGLTKREFARAIRVNEKTLQNWEHDLHEPHNRYKDVLSSYLSVLNKKNELTFQKYSGNRITPGQHFFHPT